ncbi:hypothetical protein C8R47DRAFT_931389, partial [Mycena vitilis]
RVLICTTCNSCVWRTTAWKHGREKHGGERLSDEEKEELAEMLDVSQVPAQPADYPHPWGAAPVHGLTLQEGLVCRPCHYACPTKQTMGNHSRSEEHKSKTVAIANWREEKACIQTFFATSHQRYFLVVPAAAGLKSEDPYLLYLAQYSEELAVPLDITPPPINENEINPINRHTYWDEHLRPFTPTSTASKVLRELLAGSVPHASDLHQVSGIALEYLVRAGKLGNEASLYTRALLQQYPPDSKSPAWQPLPKHDTEDQYAAVLTRFVLGIMRSEARENKTGYRFPLSAIDKAALASFVATLRVRSYPASEAQISAFHELVKVFLLARSPENPAVGPRKFDHALQCLLAVDCLKPDGNQQDALNVTPVLARTLYHIRCALVWEGDAMAREQGLPLEETIEALAKMNIARAAYSSPFNSVTDIQRWASSIAINTVRPPSTLVSPDGMTITHGGATLRVADYRAGLKHALQDLTLQLGELLFGFSVPLDMPENLVDDWSNSTRGYSFVNNHDFIPSDSFFQHLLRSKDADLTYTDPDGRLCFKQPSINRIVGMDTKFMANLGPATASTSSISRIAEFLDGKIKNATRERTLMANGGDLWLVTRRRKWENLVKHAVFDPHLVPEPMRDILLRYVLIFRPALVRLLRIAKQEKDAMLYDEYLWVHNRERISTDSFSNLLATFTGHYCKVALTSQPHRHFQVELCRVFLNSGAAADAEGDSYLDRLRGHSRDTANKVYSIEKGTLRGVSSDEMLRLREASLLWAQVIDLRPGFEPLRPLVARRQLQ